MKYAATSISHFVQNIKVRGSGGELPVDGLGGGRGRKLLRTVLRQGAFLRRQLRNLLRGRLHAHTGGGNEDAEAEVLAEDRPERPLW